MGKLNHQSLSRILRLHFTFLRYLRLLIYFSGKSQYLVKWSGVDENGEPWADTWEPAENIEVEENEALLEAFKKDFQVHN